MNKSLFTAVTALAVLSLQPVLFAQDATPAAVGAAPKFGKEAGPGGEKGGRKEWKRDPEKRIAHLKEALGLTADQETKLRAIFTSEEEKMRAEHQANKGTPMTPEERKAKMTTAREEINTQIEAILTPEQKTKFAAMKSAAKEKMEAHRAEKPVPAPTVTP